MKQSVYGCGTDWRTYVYIYIYLFTP